MIYQHYQNEVVKHISGGKSPEKAKTFVMEEMRDSFLGDRLTTATVGSAPTSQAVKDFMVECFGVWMLDGYGSTEAGAGSVTINGFINRKFILDYKLRDVPELGYYGTDKPHPRGEFCFKGKNQIKGFFKDPEATKDLLTDDGYIITGDIVEDRGDDRIAIVDRRKDVVKLSQGEYVAVGSLGTVYEGGSPFIKQVYLYGNSHRSYLVAVVVPDMEAITHDLGRAPDTQNIRHVIRQAILEVANREKLKSFEAPRDFIVEMDVFSQENGLLSSVRKKLRPALKKKYSEALEALYDKHAQSRDAEIEALKSEGSEPDISEKLKRLMIIHLGLEDDAVISDDKNFNELGGDSLGAVNFSLLVEDVFGIIFPADKILDPTGNVLSWERDIKTLKSSGSQAASFATVHGAGRQAVEAKDLSLEAFLPIALLDAANSLSLAPRSPKTVLLTGATGFLGRHVCLEWLAQLEDKDSRLICLVRANDNEAAHKRLTDIFEASPPDMREAFKRLSEGKLEILAADISMPEFGLTPEKFQELGQIVDRICHVGALVNHRLSYEHLFAPNVAGTAEIIKLALTHNRKPIDFVSTVSVLSCLDRAEPNKEKAAPAQTLPLSDAYASGYATSKWAAEILLRKAAEKSGVPVNILRGNMMLSHRKYVGAINPSDMFTRLLFSLISTGFAPQSFYTRAEVNYDGLPVDLIASCVVNMGQNFDNGVTVMNANHYHSGNDFSLDSIVREIKILGYEVDTIDDYEDWFKRFSDRLNALPEAEKQKSALDLLPAFKHPQTSQVQSSVKNFRKLVNSLGVEAPELTSDYIAKIIGDMNAIGLLPASTNYFIPKEN